MTVWASFRDIISLGETCAHLRKTKTLHAPCALPLKSMNASGLPSFLAEMDQLHDHSSAKAYATDGEIVTTLHLPVMVTNSPMYRRFIPGLGRCLLSDILTCDDYWQDNMLGCIFEINIFKKFVLLLLYSVHIPCVCSNIFQ